MKSGGEITIFSCRFHVKGWKKAVFEVAGEGMNLGTAGFVLLLALALPAFEETKGDWRAQSDFAVTFLDRYGNEIGQLRHHPRGFRPHRRVARPSDQGRAGDGGPPLLHPFPGIDFLGLARAVNENARAGGVVQGRLHAHPAARQELVPVQRERTIERKIKEAFLALWLEANLSKKEILRLYLDRAYMGGGTFGAAAAAQFYFGKNVTEVNLAESAMLAGLFKAPARYAPHVNSGQPPARAPTRC